MTEMFKINRGISSPNMKGMFEPRAEHPYNLRCISQFSVPLVSTVFDGTESISFLEPKIWNLLPENFKNIDSFGISRYWLRSGNLKAALAGYARST